MIASIQTALILSDTIQPQNKVYLDHPTLHEQNEGFDSKNLPSLHQ